jgi:hypothetical protein
MKRDNHRCIEKESQNLTRGRLLDLVVFSSYNTVLNELSISLNVPSFIHEELWNFVVTGSSFQ